MKVQFANGLIFDALDIDDAVNQCLASRNDPHNPVVIPEKPKQNKKKKEENADTEQQ